ncbi:MAG: hypothetical protein NTW14_13740 [bacterium]|nr:hypothetical protein [bacterium]
MITQKNSCSLKQFVNSASAKNRYHFWRLVALAYFLAPLYGLLIRPVTSLAAVNISPSVQELTINRGATKTFVINVKNLDDIEAPCRFEVFNMDITPQGNPVIADSNYTKGFEGWISFAKSEFTLKPFENMKLEGKVTVPKNAEGGYYALVRGNFSEREAPIAGPESGLKESRFGVVTQAAVVLILTVPSGKNSAIIVPDSLQIYPNGMGEEKSKFGMGSSNGWGIIMPVHNEGNLHTQVSGYISIWTESGKKIASQKLNTGRGYVLPGKTREFTAFGNENLADGYYLIRMTLQTREGKVKSNSYPFAIYEGKLRPGEITSDLSSLLLASSPGFVIDEPFIQKKITPGGVSNLSIRISNNRKDTLTLYPQLREWNFDDQAQPEISAEKSLQPRSCSGWLEIPQDTLVLPPMRSNNLKVTTHFPGTASGEYFAAVLFRRDNDPIEIPRDFLPGRTQLFALSTPKNAVYGVLLDSIRTEVKKINNIDITRFTFEVQNTGNTHCYVLGRIAVEKEASKEFFKPTGESTEFGDENFIMLPGNTRSISIDIPALEKGSYRLLLNLQYAEKSEPIIRSQRLTIK